MMKFSEFKKNKKNNFPTDRPIPEKQGRVRRNKNIFKVGLIVSNFFYFRSLFKKKALYFRVITYNLYTKETSLPQKAQNIHVLFIGYGDKMRGTNTIYWPPLKIVC